MMCKVCGAAIPAERLEALPDTKTCTVHSTVIPNVGYMIPMAAKGTAPVLCFVPQDAEARRLAYRANRRSR